MGSPKILGPKKYGGPTAHFFLARGPPLPLYPKNQKYISIPFICHLRERSVPPRAELLPLRKNVTDGQIKGNLVYIYSNTFHLPPLGALCDHPELSYSKTNFCRHPCRLPVPVPAMLTPKIKNI